MQTVVLPSYSVVLLNLIRKPFDGTLCYFFVALLPKNNHLVVIPYPK